MSTLWNGLVSGWRLEEGATGPYVDFVGSNDWTEVGSLTSTTGKRGNAILINAVETLTRTTAAGTMDFSGGGWSISLWLNPTDNTSTDNRYIYSALDDDGLPASYVSLRHEESDDGTNPNKIRFKTTESGGSAESHFSTTAFTTLSGSYHHIVATWDDTTKAKKLYIDNALEINATTTHSGPLGPGIALSHASHNIGIGPTNPYHGAFDEVYWWNRALTSTEVSDLYNGGNGLFFPFPVPVFLLLGGL